MSLKTNREEKWGKSKMPMGYRSGPVNGSPVPSQVERLRKFYRDQADNAGYSAGTTRSGAMLTGDPPSRQLAMAKQADINAEKNPAYQARQMAWRTQQAGAAVKEQEAMEALAAKYDTMTPDQRKALGSDLLQKLKKTKLQLQMDELREKMALGLMRNTVAPKPIHRWG